MSYNIDIVVAPCPADTPAAWAMLAPLRERYGNATSAVHPSLKSLYKILVKRYQCLSSCADADLDSCAWSDGPLIDNFSDEMAVLGLNRSAQLADVLRFVIASAHALRLTVFDPQTGLIHRPPDTGLFTVSMHGVLEGCEPEDVLAKLAGLVKLDRAQLQTLLATPGTVVKRDLPCATAERYFQTLRAIGCDCHLSVPDHWVVLQESAQGGDADAQFQLAEAYRARFDQVLAAQWLEKAAEQGHIEAAAMLADLYYGGEGVPKDYTVALYWTRLAARGGVATAQYLLWRMLDQGEGTRPNKEEAADWLARAAAQGEVRAQHQIGQTYLHEKRFEQALEWLTKAAKQGSPEAESCLAVMYMSGTGVERDTVRGMAWMVSAASLGLASAQHNLAITFQGGAGVARDTEQCLHWLRKAADQGYASSQFELGQLYRHGIAVTKDIDYGVSLIGKAAVQGHTDALFTLGGIIMSGDGPYEADPAFALNFLRPAAAQGHAEAARFVAMIEQRYGKR